MMRVDYFLNELLKKVEYTNFYVEILGKGIHNLDKSENNQL